jgi:hypothetical protein
MYGWNAEAAETPAIILIMSCHASGQRKEICPKKTDKYSMY